MNRLINKLAPAVAIASMVVLGSCGVNNTLQAQYPNNNNGYNNGYNNQYNNGYNNNQYNNGYQDNYGQGGYQDYYGYQNEYEDPYADYSMFYDELSPYGTWMRDPYYGFVWRPRVGRNFRPYFTNGSWMMTDMGNMWVSNYRWGWIPFHYGRWTYDNWYGWMWIPGRQWAPAWVMWRQGSSMFGWCPMGPGMGFDSYNAPMNWWSFVGGNYLYSGNYHRHGYMNNQYNYYNNTTVINNYGNYQNTRFHAGPRIDDVRRTGVRDVKVYNVNNVNTRAQHEVAGNNVRVYAPQVNTTRNIVRDNGKQPVISTPRKFESIDNKRAISVEGVRKNDRNIYNGNQNTRIEQAPVRTQPSPRVEQAPVRTQPTPRIEQAPVRTQPTPRIEQAPVRTQPTPRIEQAPVRTQPTPRIEQAPVRTQPTPRIEQAPVRTQPTPRMEQAPVRTQPAPRMEQAPVRSQPAPRMEQAPMRSQAPSRIDQAPRSNSNEGRNEINSRSPRR